LLKNFLGSVLEWWKGQGFERFYLLSAHGDPHHIEALESLDPHTVKVLELYEYDMTGILEKQPGAKHAGEAETSVMMYLYPEKVRRAEIQDFETPFEEFEPYLLHEKTGAIKGSPGNQGYPSWASADKGRRLFSRMKAHALGWLVDDTVQETIECCKWREEHGYDHQHQPQAEPGGPGHTGGSLAGLSGLETKASR
jgi:creatinine amidohydrolase/Fe(II)-dependent formamide hydrolase-like protein